MQIIDYVIIAVIAAIVGVAAWYVHRSKKSGKKCIGCPDGGSCSGNCAGCTGCGSNTK